MGAGILLEALHRRASGPAGMASYQVLPVWWTGGAEAETRGIVRSSSAADLESEPVTGGREGPFGLPSREAASGPRRADAWR